MSKEVWKIPALNHHTSTVVRNKEELHIALSLRIPIEPVALGSLPRFELKAK